MKLGFLSNHNPLDKNAFSSTSHFMWRALCENQSCTVRILGNHRRPRRFIDKLWRPSVGPGQLEPNTFEGLDAIVSLVSTDLVVKYGNRTKVPIIHCTDATPGFLQEFYGDQLPSKAFEEERLAYESAEIILFSSDFMRARAVHEFGEQFASKMASLLWGANLESFPSELPEKPPLTPLRLLFIGKDWARKGGDIVIETLKELKRRGVAAELHLVGTSAGDIGNTENVIDHGYLNKNKQKDRLALEGILNSSHFLVLPTRADCTPMVVAEANSHGIPVLISDVGGIASLMHNGRNGEMLSTEAGAGEYADRLIALSTDQAKYHALCRSSFEHFLENLTWSAWSDAVVSHLNERVAR